MRTLASQLRDGVQVQVVNSSRGLVEVERARVAAHPWSRMRGLLGRSELPADEGLLILPCQGVHTLGMSFPIDVLYVDKQGIVRKVIRNCRPWRFGPVVWRGHLVLELAAGTARAEAGDQLVFEVLDARSDPHPE